MTRSGIVTIFPRFGRYLSRKCSQYPCITKKMLDPENVLCVSIYSSYQKSIKKSILVLQEEFSSMAASTNFFPKNAVNILSALLVKTKWSNLHYWLIDRLHKYYSLFEPIFFCKTSARRDWQIFTSFPSKKLKFHPCYLVIDVSF